MWVILSHNSFIKNVFLLGLHYWRDKKRPKQGLQATLFTKNNNFFLKTKKKSNLKFSIKRFNQISYYKYYIKDLCAFVFNALLTKKNLTNYGVASFRVTLTRICPKPNSFWQKFKSKISKWLYILKAHDARVTCLKYMLLFLWL